jgi:hypothetical protein
MKNYIIQLPKSSTPPRDMYFFSMSNVSTWLFLSPPSLCYYSSSLRALPVTIPGDAMRPPPVGAPPSNSRAAAAPSDVLHQPVVHRTNPTPSSLLWPSAHYCTFVRSAGSRSFDRAAMCSSIDRCLLPRLVDLFVVA